jgi:hypothetical protein
MSPYQNRFLSLRLSVALALAGALGAAGPAPAESLAPREVAPAATVRIETERLTPDRARIAEGRTLRIANRSSGMARVEFHLERGSGLPCAVAGEAPVSARKFVVDDGDALHCVPPRGTVEYRVQRVVDSRNRISEGEIEVR